MYLFVEYIVVVVFQWVLLVEIMIVGQFECDIYCLNGVVGDGDFCQIGFDGGKVQCGGLFQQVVVDQQQFGDLFDFFLYLWQMREWMVEIGGYLFCQLFYQLVVSGVGNVVIDCCQQCCLLVGEQVKWFGLGGGWCIGWLDIYCVFCCYLYVVKNNFMVVGGLYFGVILVFYYVDVWVVVRYQSGVYQWWVIIVFGLYCQLVQFFNVGGINFMVVDVLVFCVMGCYGVWQVVLCWGVQFWFDVQVVDEVIVFDSIVKNLLVQWCVSGVVFCQL